MSRYLPEDPRKKPLKRVHTCAYCVGHTHVIDKDIHPNDSIAREFPENSGKWRCGNCEEEAMYRTRNRHGLVSQKEIEERMSKLKRKADLTGLTNAVKSNDYTANFSHLFKSPGIYDKRKKIK